MFLYPYYGGTMMAFPFSLEDKPTRKHEVFPHIFLGPRLLAIQVRNGKMPNIARVVSFCDGRIHHIPVLKIYDASQHGDTYLTALKGKQVIRFMDESLAKGEDLLIHCEAGESRSVALVIIYLMERFHLDFSEARQRLEQRYRWVNISPSIVESLSKEGFNRHRLGTGQSFSAL